MRRLAALRRASPALQLGSQRFLDAGADVLAWIREEGDERLAIAVNFATSPAPLLLPAGELVVSTEPGRADLADRTLAPGEAIIVRPAPAP